MKKIIQTIKLRKFKTKINENILKSFENQEFLVCFRDNTCKEDYHKYELINLLEKDHIKPIRCIFDMTDRITLDRDIKVDISEVLNEL